MGSEGRPLQTKGIFRNLPTFDPSIQGKTALVTGANGISGFHTMRVLLESPERWTKVWAASRRPPPPEMMELLPKEARSRVEQVACDFLTEPEEIAKKFKEKGVQNIYVLAVNDVFVLKLVPLFVWMLPLLTAYRAWKESLAPNGTRKSLIH